MNLRPRHWRRPSNKDAQLRNGIDSSRRCPSADGSSSLAPGKISPYPPPRLLLDILYLILNLYSVFYLHSCRLVCLQPRRHSILHALIMADNRCAGPLTISSPTINSWRTKPISSTSARLTVLCPPSRPTTRLRRLRGQGTPWRGEAPSCFKTVIPVTCSDSVCELNCGLLALGDILCDSSTELDFLRFPSVLAEGKKPE